jgi:biotin carboxylase
MPASATIVMVDAYTSSLRLARAFMQEGHAVVAVQTRAEAPPIYRAGVPRLGEFTDIIVHRGDLAQTREAVAAHHPLAVVVGNEPGVELADALSESLGLPTNGTALSSARRDKYRQGEELRDAGLRATRQILVTDLDQLADFQATVGSRIVVKPARSAGNDGVTVCDTAEEAMTAYKALLGAVNILMERNHGVVAQEYLIGTEYAVNTVSCEGRHRVTDIWRYSKLSVHGVIDRHAGAHSIPADAAERYVLTSYATSVLDVLGVRYGPAHLEVMLTPTGPCLVEAGIRLCGADAAYYAEQVAGESQLGWTVAAYTDPQHFLTTWEQPQRIERHAAMAYLTSPVAGILRSYPLLDQVEALESFHKLHYGVRPGQRLRRTVDDGSEPLMIGLVHPVNEVVLRDLASVNYLDGHGFYEVEPDGEDAAS